MLMGPVQQNLRFMGIIKRYGFSKSLPVVSSMTRSSITITAYIYKAQHLLSHLILCWLHHLKTRGTVSSFCVHKTPFSPSSLPFLPLDDSSFIQRDGDCSMFSSCWDTMNFYRQIILAAEEVKLTVFENFGKCIVQSWC